MVEAYCGFEEIKVIYVQLFVKLSKYIEDKFCDLTPSSLLRGGACEGGVFVYKGRN